MEETTQLVVMPPPEITVREPASAVVDSQWRTISARPYGGLDERRRSVVLPAALAALAICGGPCLLFLLSVVVAR